jgi:hypothetical protein
MNHINSLVTLAPVQVSEIFNIKLIVWWHPILISISANLATDINNPPARHHVANQINTEHLDNQRRSNNRLGPLLEIRGMYLL